MRVRWDRRRTSFAAALTVPAVVAGLALLQQGFPVSRLDLDDGGVWLTSKQDLALGRYNVPVEELDGGLASTSSVLDVAQDGAQVLLVEPASVSLVDPASVAVTTRVAIGTGDAVAMAGGTVVVTSADGDIWVRALGELAGLDVAAGTPDVALGSGGRATVTRDGAVLTVSASGATATRVPAVGGSTVTAGADLDGSVQKIDQLTAVGDEPVVLDGHTVRTRTGSVELDGGQLTLQQPGPAADTVLVASADTLYEVPLDGGRPIAHRTAGAGTPAAPVRVGSCDYAAWASSSGNWMRLCGDEVTSADREGLTSADELTFRVNRSRVVLNDVTTGRAWLPDDPRVRVPDWQQITPEQSDTTPDQDAGTQVTQAQSAQCSEEGAPPSAVDDTFGVRPGRTTVLPVLDNDATSDCGILVISQVDPVPAAFGRLEVVQGGRALQVAVPADATGEVSFTYTITDRPGTRAPATATVRLRVRDDSVNDPPTQVRTPTMQVEQGGSLDQNVLADFVDPDGDGLVLLGATIDPTFGTVTTRPDGTLTVHGGGRSGSTVVTVEVTDGRSDPVSGTVEVEVRDVGVLAPQIDPMHAVGYVNQAVVISPLKAVRSSSTEPVRLAGVGDVPGATIVPDLRGGTFSFTAGRAGTYYVSFTVVASPSQSTGWVRIDVEEYPDQVQPPVAMADRALLPAGGSVTIDPLANDEDPNNLVLVLQGVDVPEGSGLHVAVVEHRLLEISADRILGLPVSVPYTVSNGTSAAVGSILVQSVTASTVAQPPVVPDVEVGVRTGGVVTVSALDGAYDPNGGGLTLSRTLPEPLTDGQGLLFVSGDVLRYQAPDVPMTVSTIFQVTNSAGISTAARLTVRVHASDASTKAAPTPRSVVARVFEAETVRIPIPLQGIDADGDGVTLLGLGDDAPKLGIVTAVGPDYLEYRALPGSTGTDTFTYAVEDWTGQRAVGQVRVGISPWPTVAATVVARDDAVTVVPGRTVEVRVLANDVDSGGGDLSLLDTLELSGDVGTGADAAQASVQGSRVVVRAPTTPGVLSVVYTASNTRGGRDSAVLTVTVDAAAPVLPPVAQDVVVPAADTIGRAQVDVDVLAVAQNPSGPLSDLEVVVPATAAGVASVAGRGTVRISLADHAQTVPYQLVNSTDRSASSYAFITVPALGFFPPTPRPKAPALRVASGAELVIALDSQVQVAPGRTASIADATRVTATRSDGSALVVNASTLRFVSAAGYSGPASVTVPVTDSTGTGDGDARESTITLSITVYATDEHPPTFTPSKVQVGPGEAPLTVDLTAFMRDPEGDVPKAGDYGFKLTDAVPAGFTATLTGSVLKIAAAATTAKGTTGTLSLAISYGTSGTLPVTLPLEVIASTRPLARVLDQTIADGVSGVERTLSVLDGAFNPF
ncbi:MAG: cadherin-like domain-containing protein, partial [Actinobacteria bacterium]|nr:cadherin-like domain-containing protein [Actinomycetota bacterium]MCG2801272.1 cadherin-like domain-containing protein [Cellulomonas sp.]